jgi:Fe-S cluster assembly iron-binding protein IscA
VTIIFDKIQKQFMSKQFYDYQQRDVQSVFYAIKGSATRFCKRHKSVNWPFAFKNPNTSAHQFPD